METLFEQIPTDETLKQSLRDKIAYCVALDKSTILWSMTEVKLFYRYAREFTLKAHSKKRNQGGWCCWVAIER